MQAITPWQPVVQQHEDEDEQDADGAGEDALLQEVEPERGADLAEADLAIGQRQRAVLECRDEVVDLGGGETARPARDLSLAAEALRVDVGADTTVPSRTIANCSLLGSLLPLKATCRELVEELATRRPSA